MTCQKVRRIWSITGNSQRLDGGAMFGNAPRALWQRWLTPDKYNRIPLSCRGMLVQEPDGRLVLFEAGIGAFFAPELRVRYGVQEDDHILLRNLESKGIGEKDIDVVVISHLHFDHAGGLLTAYQEGEPPKLCFPNASYVVSQEAWKRAKKPHLRDRVSYIPELQTLLEKSGRLELVTTERRDILGSYYNFRFSHGHTPGLLMVEIETKNGPILFPADMIPGAPWMHLPITMGYDRYPELLIDEKSRYLEELYNRGGKLFFTHDHEFAMVSIDRDTKGRFRAGEKWAELDGFEIE